MRIVTLRIEKREASAPEPPKVRVTVDGTLDELADLPSGRVCDLPAVVLLPELDVERLLAQWKDLNGRWAEMGDKLTVVENKLRPLEEVQDELRRTQFAREQLQEELRCVYDVAEDLRKQLYEAKSEVARLQAELARERQPNFDRWAVGCACGQWFAEAPWRFGSRFVGIEVD